MEPINHLTGRPGRRVRWAVLPALLLLAGCAADHQARSLANATLQNTAAYEHQVGTKVSAEAAFYRDQQARLRAVLNGNTAVTHPDSRRTYAVTNTLAYGRLRTAAERDARLAADEMVADQGTKTMSLIIGYLDRGVKEDLAFQDQVVRRQRELAEEFLARLEKIERQQARLRAVRDKLTALGAEPSLRQQLESLVRLGQAVEGKLKEKGQGDGS